MRVELRLLQMNTATDVLRKLFFSVDFGNLGVGRAPRFAHAKGLSYVGLRLVQL